MLASLRSDGWTASPELVDDFTGIRIHCRRSEQIHRYEGAGEIPAAPHAAHDVIQGNFLETQIASVEEWDGLCKRHWPPGQCWFLLGAPVRV
jgi:hypothetical protein